MIKVKNENRKWFQFWKPKMVIVPPVSEYMTGIYDHKPEIGFLNHFIDNPVGIDIIRGTGKINQINKKQYENNKR